MTAEEGRFPEIACCMQQLFLNAVFQTCVQNPLKIPISPETRTVPSWLMVAQDLNTHCRTLTALAEEETHLTAHQAKSRERGPHVANLNEFVRCLLKPGYSGEYLGTLFTSVNRGGAMSAPCGSSYSSCISILAKSPSSLLKNTHAHHSPGGAQCLPAPTSNTGQAEF